MTIERWAVVGAVWMTWAGTALAEPQPDGPCGELMDATPGLFGLCLAICDEDSEPTPAVVDAYHRRMTADDPEPWCLQDDSAGACPCFDTAALDAIDFGGRWDQQRMVDDTQGVNWCATDWSHSAGVSWYADGTAMCSYDGVSQDITTDQALACDQTLNDYALAHSDNWYCSAPDGVSCDFLTP